MASAFSMHPTEAPSDAAPRMEPGIFQEFRALVREKTGMNLRDGKNVMLESRLNRRLRHHSLHSFADYLRLLRSSPSSEEMTEFINCVTTNKTAFFRESHHFDFLLDTLLPELIQRGPASPRTLRIWSAACSTGEEPYSIAMTLQHAALRGYSVQIEASDVDTRVLETARRAIYPAASLCDLEPDFCKRFFLRGKADMAGMVQLKEPIRAAVRFQRINLIDARWPVEGGLDAIFFRNALIYFDREMQERFLRRMVQLLRPGGYLFLGHSEHVPWLFDVVTPLPKTIYKRHAQTPPSSQPPLLRASLHTGAAS